MRLREIALTGFRAFAETTTVDLSSDCTILVGKNGQGKTSLLDGLFWVLTGRLERIGNDESLVSLYSDTGGATVSVTFFDGDEDLVVRRRFDGGRTSLNCRLGGRTLDQEEIRRRYGALIAFPGESATELAFANATMARSLYLQQDAMRDFVTADTDDSRFRVVADLCGLRRATDLQVTLQRERKAWTQATNKLRAEVRWRQQRVSELVERSSLFGATTQSEWQLSSEWVKWWARLKTLGVMDMDATPEVSASDASAGLERAIRALDARRLAAERRRTVLSETIRKAGMVADGSLEGEALLTVAVKEAQHAEEQVRRAFHAAEVRNSQVAEKRLREKVSADELCTLSELALRHLGERCPVCGQLHNKEKTEGLLRERMGGRVAALPPLEDLAPLLTQLTTAQQDTIRQMEALREAEAKNARTLQLRVELGEAAAELELESGLAVEQSKAELERLQAEVVEQLQELSSIRTAGEDLSVAIARSREWAQRGEARGQLEAARKDVERREDVVVARERAGRVATTIIEEIREASLQIVEEELHRIEPLLQRIWSGIDPHPSLRAVSLVTRLGYGKGRLSFEVRDEVGNVSSEAPETVLSSSQVNALAVALFLTLNLGTESLPLAATVLDDPFQALDDINLLGLIDLLRRVRGGRQIILATHEAKLGQLLARKLRPIKGEQTTKVIEFDNWNVRGPEITERVAARDPAPFRFVA